jgi:CRP/FNR family transcriptional regulator, cyclic AMP receptor protein
VGAVEWALLQVLSGDERRDVIASARRRRFSGREVLFHAGDPGEALHLIASGWVAVYVTTPVGSTASFAVLGPGEAVGELALISPGERSATAIALEPTETLSLRRNQFDDLRRRHLGIDRLLVELLAERVRRLDRELVEAYFVGAEMRVIRRLLAVARRMPERDGRRAVRLTQEDLAGLAGTSRPTVNRALRELERAGAIAQARGRVDVLDLALLADRGR